MKVYHCLIVALLSLWSVSAGAQALSVEIDNAPAYNKQEQTLRVLYDDGTPAADVWLHARYYPRTTVQRGELICKTNAEGTCTWTPQYAGLVRIRVDDHEPALRKSGVLTDREREKTPLHTQTFSIWFDGAPASGIVMFIIAATTLLSALIWSMTELLWRAPRREALAALNEPPDA